MPRFLLVIFILFLATASHAQPYALAWKRSVPVVAAYSNNIKDAFAFTTNPALLVTAEGPAVALYDEKRFALRELNFFSLAYSTPFSSAAIGVEGRYAGSSAYRETMIGMSVAKKLTDLISAGVQFGYHTSKAAGATAGLVKADAGVTFQMTKAMQCGFRMQNVFSTKSKMMDLPSVYGVGLGYDCATNFFVSIMMEKQVQYPLNITAAFHYAVVPSLYVHGGITTAEDDVFFGVGLHWSREVLEINTGYQQPLGFTPSVAMVFSFEKKKK